MLDFCYNLPCYAPMKWSFEEPQDSSEILVAFFAGSKCNIDFCNGILIFNVSSRVLPPQSFPGPIWYVAAVYMDINSTAVIVVTNHPANLLRLFSASLLQLLTLF
jgi:hypothetical protein